jgi:hypothetical protein
MKQPLIIDNPQDIFRAPAEQGLSTDASVGALFGKLSRKYELILTCTQTDDVSHFLALCHAYRTYLKHVSIAPPSYQEGPGFSHADSAIISKNGQLRSLNKISPRGYMQTRLPSLSPELPQQIASRMLIYSNIEELYTGVMRLVRFSPGLIPVVAQAKPKAIIVGRTFISSRKLFKLQSTFPGIEYIAACMEHTNSPAFCEELKALIELANIKLTESTPGPATPLAPSDDDTISRTSPSSSGGGSPRLLSEAKSTSSSPLGRCTPVPIGTNFSDDIVTPTPSPAASPVRPSRIAAVTSLNDVSIGPPVGYDPGSAFRRLQKSPAPQPRTKTKFCAIM